MFYKKGVLRNFTKFTEKHLCQDLFFKGKDTLWNFSIRAFHEIQFQGHFTKHKKLSWNTFALVSKIHCVRFSSIKKLCLQKKGVKCNIIKKYLLPIKQKQKNSKIPKRIWMKTCSKNQKRQKCTYWHIFRTSVNYLIPELSWDYLCNIMLLIIHWLSYIDYL